MLWFDNPIFKDINLSAGASASSEGAKRAPKPAQGPMPPPAGGNAKSGAKSAGGKKKAASQDDDDDDFSINKENRGMKESDGFEEVKADSSESDSDSDYSEDDDDVAELAALGALLKKKKIRKEELIDACYHRCPRCVCVYVCI